ncbi:MAG: YbaN family protein [Brevinematales bacterium]|nr:YbaN family protein [Brevinematales bacterium]
MAKILLFSFGTISLGLGVIGIFVPGLPTTPFLILSATCYLKSSKKFYNWLINNSLFGQKIKIYLEKKSIPLKTKIKAIITVVIMLCFSILFINKVYLKIIVLVAGLIGIFVLTKIKSER